MYREERERQKKLQEEEEKIKEKLQKEKDERRRKLGRGIYLNINKLAKAGSCSLGCTESVNYFKNEIF